jgi:N-glycosylase/DNA lyase
MKTLKERIEHSVQKDFDFWLTARGSGWSSLAPFTLQDEARSLSRVQRLGSGKVVRATVSQGRRGVLIIEAESRDSLDGADLEETEEVVGTCLGLEEDLAPFYSMLEAYPEFRWVAEIGAGRSVRSPTVFEDIVKTICTTNASWALTKGITRRLCEKLGDPFDGESHTFPTPKQMALTTDEFMRREIKSGYRSPYLVELAQRVVNGDLDVESWSSSPSDSASLKREVMGIKGVGNFASDNILKLLGRYDFLALDSWMRKRFSVVHGGGEVVSDDEIEEFYVPFGGWRGLVMQLDMTKEYLIKAER